MQKLWNQYWLTGLLSFIALFSCIKTVHRYTQPDSPYDARNVFLAGKLWQKKLNPYNDSLLKAEWKTIALQNKLNTSQTPGFPNCGMIYPNWSIPALIPYYFLPWPLSKIFIWVFSWLLIIGIAWFGFKSFSQSNISFALVFMPMVAFKSGPGAVALGQPVLLSLFAIMICWYFYQKKQDTVSGFWLGLACVKITVCIPFLIFFLANKNWKLLFMTLLIPLISLVSFYINSGQLYIPEMLANMSRQMHINYGGHVYNAVNTNLTELGILFNYFGNVGYEIISKFNLVLFAMCSIVVYTFYKKGMLEPYHFLGLLILINFLFSYHLIYDCLLLVFLIPIFSRLKQKWQKWLAGIILLPLILPINKLIKIPIFQFHLPITLLVLLLYLVYDSYQIYRSRRI